MSGPAGVNGLAGLQTLSVDTPFATAEDRLGDSADPRHSKTGESNTPPNWQSMQVPGAQFPVRDPQDGVFDDHDYYPLAAGNIDNAVGAWDIVPWTHKAPWPANPIGDGSVGPDNTARQLCQNYELRNKAGRNGFADPSLFGQGLAQQDEWQEIWNVTPGSVDLTEVPAQMRSGAAPGGKGGTDRTQSNAHQNEYDFDAAHMHRRYATGSIPGNYMWLRPAGRPLIKSLANTARPPIGPGSQFAGNDLGAAFDYTSGAILQNSPVEYSAPPQPYVAPSAQDDGYVPSWDEGYYGS